MFAAERSFAATVSYSEAHEFLVEPITDRIIASLEMAGAAAVASDAAPITLSRPPPQPTADGSLLSLLVLSAILTWGIGLAPPLLIRFAFLRRPIGNGPALALVAVLWLFNVTLFTALGSQSRTH